MAPIPDPLSPPGPDWKDVLSFVRDQGAADRTSFDRIFSRTAWFLGVLVAALTVAVTLLARWSIGQSIAEAKALVRERVNAEFDTPRIKQTLSEVAQQKYSNELQRLMAAEVARQVAVELKQQEQFIRQSIVSETARQLRGRQSPRVINDSIRHDLISVLKKKAPVRFTIECVGANSEACDYARQYLDMFRLAGWKDYVQLVHLQTIPEAIRQFTDPIILVVDVAHPPASATALVELLLQGWPAANFPIEGDPTGSPDIPRLFIPLKPI
jgi:hypothetical protein